ncbi:DUF4870 family protein [Marinobacter shengliensis]|jgi:uncharacterized membrane protein|uniref:DUF4870 family protein n=1 Tax=Marinobacter shengliensis TaxID=1389223 RepID=UPI0035B92D91
MENTDLTTPNQQSAEPANGINQSEKQFALIVYILQAVSIFIGVTSIVGVIMNHVKSGSLTDPVIKSHNSWQIRTFWWMLLWSALCMILATVTLGLGAILILVPLVWYIYRIVKGVMRLNDGKSV